MFGSKLLLAASTIATALACADDTTIPVPKAPGLTFLYSCNVTLGTTVEYGNGPKGMRVAIPITGGPILGSRIKGNFINLGADWGVVDALGTFNPDTRYGMTTDDGASIYIQTSGPNQKDGKGHLRMIFETGNANYTWLNEIVAVGILTPGDGYVSIDAWQLESPPA